MQAKAHQSANSSNLIKEEIPPRIFLFFISRTAGNGGLVEGVVYGGLLDG